MRSAISGVENFPYRSAQPCSVSLTSPPRRPVLPGGSTNPSSAARPTSRRSDFRSISSHSANSCVVALPPKIQSAEINAIISHPLFFVDFPDFGHKKSPHQGAAKNRGKDVSAYQRRQLSMAIDRETTLEEMFYIFSQKQLEHRRERLCRDRR